MVAYFRTDLPRARHLVGAQWLHALLAGTPVPHAPPGKWILLEVACAGLDDFAHSHIPGAGYLDTQTLETLPFWNAPDDAVLLRLLAASGIDRQTTVILYGRNLLAAARLAHLLLYAGVGDVRFLDAGFQGWCQAGYALESGPPRAPVALSHFGADLAAQPQFKISLAQARDWQVQVQAQAQGQGQGRQQGRHVHRVLVSIRTWEEHSGQTSGYSYISALGDIPGALWGHAGKGGDVNDMSDFVQADGTLRSAATITAMWKARGITPDRDIAFYCGTGWRASLAFLCAWLMGWERICVFDGGWYEWSASQPQTAAQ